MNKPLLRQLDYLPDGVCVANPATLQSILPEPTIIHLPGKHPAPLFVSVLLHGNETTGLMAIQQLLQKYKDRQLPRALSIFFGNIKAAGRGLRRLDEQPDYNRIWPGAELPDCPETQMAAEIVAIMETRKVFASIDIHNNTGLNPHYACINNLDSQFLQLASLFSRLVVYFTSPKGVQSAAFAQICPAVTLECGRPGQKYGVEHAFEYLDCCLHLLELPQHPTLPRNIDLFHTVAQVNIADNINFSFNQADAEFMLDMEIERLNFTEIAAGTVFGKLNQYQSMPVIVKDPQGRIVTDEFFSIQNGELQINRLTMPSMLTLDERVIKQDCLCYLMERMHL